MGPMVLLILDGRGSESRLKQPFQIRRHGCIVNECEALRAPLQLRQGQLVTTCRGAHEGMRGRTKNHDDHPTRRMHCTETPRDTPNTTYSVRSHGAKSLRREAQRPEYETNFRTKTSAQEERRRDGKKRAAATSKHNFYTGGGIGCGEHFDQQRE